MSVRESYNSMINTEGVDRSIRIMISVSRKSAAAFEKSRRWRWIWRTRHAENTREVLGAIGCLTSAAHYLGASLEARAEAFRVIKDLQDLFGKRDSIKHQDGT